MVIRMVEGKHLHKCYSFAKDHGEDLKVAIAIGVHLQSVFSGISSYIRH